MKTFCPECRKDVEYKIEEQFEEKEVRGLKFKYTAERAYCNDCGEEIFISKLHDHNLQKIDDAYRKEAGIIKVSEIKEIVDQYNTGKRPLSLLLGWGETTLTRYLDGDIPSKSYSETLKKIKDDYNYMRQLAEENRDKVTDKAYNDFMEAIKKLQHNELKTEKKIDSVIKYLLKELGEVTPLALQKLLYYSQGFYKTFYDEFLFNDNCEAWVHGPVYKDIYFKYRNFGYNPIEDESLEFKNIELTEAEEELLDSIIDNFGCYSAKTLEKMTHSERPWRLTRKNLKAEEKSDEIISKELIADYFRDVNDKYKMLNVEDINDYSEQLFIKIK
ncbi:type II TA system antitoxin MqsA family protein [Halanaerobium kushneri]|uniref:Putative zinc finger/helix-turn-helix protein, YgiT family n=1 Tax=Halanaerobium kushneri TaxID=56779 RepID=A0A1N6RZ04_9FIRM|nr:type II TA system antitoxin MqsA family protein [Halanaerobium kushneri]SIQ34017.1 putative zinc finger/helix-turn-helix protein, YgiT family [Halanaerobium kushneri]